MRQNRARLQAFLKAFREGRIKFVIVGDGMIGWKWVDAKD